MSRERKIDLDNVANELARHGTVESVRRVDDLEKMSEIFERSAKTSLRLLASNRRAFALKFLTPAHVF
jgi:hypothetical protein